MKSKYAFDIETWGQRDPGPWGAPGKGKSAIIKKVAKKRGKKVLRIPSGHRRKIAQAIKDGQFVDIKLPKTSKIDLRGIPTPKSWEYVDHGPGMGRSMVGFFDELPHTPWKDQYRAFKMLSDQVVNPFSVRACSDDRAWEKERLKQHTRRVCEELEEENNLLKAQKVAYDKSQQLGEEIEELCKNFSPEDQARIWKLWLKQHNGLFSSAAFTRFAVANIHLFAL